MSALTRLVLKFNSSEFNEHFVLQKNGTAMGTNRLSDYANILITSLVSELPLILLLF